ncbi:hypothetical protein PanWU01x14_248220 [Parasponia andersonii]|uniref:Aspartic peptidase domain containing protein n=1 Tax=Parasponia andersonii TaxID=3476 RepID=A0A2P5BDS0_PARAD|nr:hypothetical protein PanWU01x14_248220 [Parasponia andersonii]
MESNSQLQTQTEHLMRSWVGERRGGRQAILTKRRFDQISLLTDSSRRRRWKLGYSDTEVITTLRIVPTIVGRPEPTQDQEEKEKCLKRAEGRVKCLRGMGHSVNHLMSGESRTSTAPIVFTQQDLTTIGFALVGRVLVDVGSSVDILFLSTFENMGLDRSTLRPTCQPLFTFDCTRVSLLGVVTLNVCATERCLDVDFVVIDCQSSFNAIMGRGWIHAMHGVTHPPPGPKMSIKGRNLYDRHQRRPGLCKEVLFNHPEGSRCECKCLD